jgi:hypothetical protein
MFQLFSYLGGGASYMVGCSMSVHFYNTLNRRLEPFQSIEPGKVRFYSCGPTVYNYAHVGNYPGPTSSRIWFIATWSSAGSM